MKSILLSVSLLLLVIFVQKKSIFAGAILASMPILIPLTLGYILFNDNDLIKAEEYSQSLILGVLGTLGFVLGTYFAIKFNLSKTQIMFSGWVVWFLIIIIGRQIAFFK